MKIRFWIFFGIVILFYSCCDQVDCSGLTGFELKGYESDSLQNVMVYRYDTSSNFSALKDSVLLKFEKSSSTSKLILLSTTDNMDYDYLLQARGIKSYSIKVKIIKVDYQDCIKGCDPFKFPAELQINGVNQTNRSSIIIINKQ